MKHQESPVRARLREALLEKLLGTDRLRNDPAVQTAARTEVFRVDRAPSHCAACHHPVLVHFWYLTCIAAGE